MPSAVFSVRQEQYVAGRVLLGRREGREIGSANFSSNSELEAWLVRTVSRPYASLLSALRALE